MHVLLPCLELEGIEGEKIVLAGIISEHKTTSFLQTKKTPDKRLITTHIYRCTLKICGRKGKGVWKKKKECNILTEYVALWDQHLVLLQVHHNAKW